jgi:hypothetical protein
MYGDTLFYFQMTYGLDKNTFTVPKMGLNWFKDKNESQPTAKGVARTTSR